MRRVRRAAALMTVVLASSACTTVVEGSAIPGTTAAVDTRPVTVDLGNLDLCTLYPRSLSSQPGYEWPPRKDDPHCVLRATEGLYVISNDPRPFSHFLDKPDIKATSFDVIGFRAVIGYNLPDEGTTCFVNVDVADDANLEISLQDDAAPGTEFLCPKAKEMAKVVTTILPTLR